MERDEAPFDPWRLAGWAPATPPDGFAERVSATWQRELAQGSTPPSRRHRRVLWVGLVAAAAVLLAWSWAWPGRASEQEPQLAERRETRSITAGATVVAEAGSEIGWRIRGDDVQVRQDAGAAFYRVDRGSDFEVVTPHGTVTVTGTCFSVEVEKVMDRSATVKGMAIGSAISAVLVVMVYEGSVSLAAPRQTLTLEAGEHGVVDVAGNARAVRDAEPDPGDARAASSDAAVRLPGPGAMARQIQRQARRIAQLEAREADHEAELERLRAGSNEPRPSVDTASAEMCLRYGGSDDCTVAHPGPEALLDMARCGAVHTDEPMFVRTGYVDVSPETRAAAGLTDAQAQQLRDVSLEFQTDYAESLRGLYVEAGGDPMVAEGVSQVGLLGLLEELLDHEVMGEARHRLSRERAGLVAAPPADEPLSVEARYIRRRAGVGADFEAYLAERLGPELARTLRGDGWTGGQSIWSGRCEDE